MDIQQLIFNEIEKRIPKDKQSTTEIAKVLHMSSDAVYRRQRGDTALLAQELTELAKHFKISLDALLGQQSTTVFSEFSGFTKPVQSFQDFVAGALRQLEIVHSLPDPYLYYASQEIPVFQYIYFPELIQFKLYVWGTTTWDFDYLKNQPFHFDLVPYSTMGLIGKMLELYNRLPSTDLWTLNIVDYTLNQIEYVVYSRQFENPEDALLLCDRVLALIGHMRKMAEKGFKFSPDETPTTGAAFNLYHNELMYTSNTMLVTAQQHKFLVAVFCNPNYLRSTDQKLCNYTYEWMENLISKSQAMSVHSKRNRKWYFNRLAQKVELAKQRITQFINQEL